MEITLTVPDELAHRLELVREQIPQILERGLGQATTVPSEVFAFVSELLTTLASAAPEEVLTLHASPQLQQRIETLLMRRRDERLDDAEEQEWAVYERLEHLARMAKAAAIMKLNAG